jgi:hypothetical protein
MKEYKNIRNKKGHDNRAHQEKITDSTGNETVFKDSN